MGWLSRSSKHATAGVLANSTYQTVDGAAPESLLGAGAGSPLADAAPLDPFSYPTWLTVFSPWVICDILVECLVLFLSDLVMAAIAHHPALWKKREDMRKAERALSAASRGAGGSDQSSAGAGQPSAASDAGDLEGLKRDLEEKRREYDATMKAYNEKRKAEGPLTGISRSYFISLLVGYVLGALHSRLYRNKYRRGVTWLFVFPEGVIPPGFISKILAFRSGRKEPGVVGYFIGRHILNRPMRKLAQAIFPPFFQQKSMSQRLQAQLAAAMGEVDRRMSGAGSGAGSGASRRATPALASRPPRVPSGGERGPGASAAGSRTTEEPPADPATDPTLA